MQTRFVDGAVAQRLLKVADFLVLALGALVLGLRSLPGNDPATSISIGFFALTLAFLCLVLLRSFKLYEPAYLASASTSATFSFGVAAISGIGLQVLAELTGLGLSGFWTTQWLMLCAVYFPLSRFSVQLWARPLL